jgi:polar amino acid transport system substrate-binding protein
LIVNFTAPYAHFGEKIIASKKIAAGFSKEDFNNADVTIACFRGTTACTTAQKHFPKAKLSLFQDEEDGIQEVLNGTSHAIIASDPKPRFWVLEYPGALFMPMEKNLKTGNTGFALRKGDPDALNFFNNWVLLNSSSQWLQERHDFWFTQRSWAGEVGQ